ncbi:MAG: hypothetical protein DCF21_11800 [Leptolyngbya sp.]|nr:MAG: hypothetical protein DCF21_11800 [Leptolyngbya sp.]
MADGGALAQPLTVSFVGCKDFWIKPVVDHVAALAAYRDIESKYFLNCETLPRSARFQYITLSNGIYYETSWLAWCDKTLATLSILPTEEGNTPWTVS